MIRQEAYFNLCKEGNEHLVVERIKRITERNKEMTPQEELFSKYFNSEKILVKDMETIQLRAHREELAQIAFEARARLTAVDDEERVRKNGSGIKGFERSINTDDITTDAINAINARAKRTDKKEKIRQNLLEMGVDPAEVDKIMSNKGIRDLSRPQAVLTGKDENKAAKSPASNTGGFDWDKIISEAKAKDLQLGTLGTHILDAEPETPKSNESTPSNSNPFSFLKKE